MKNLEKTDEERKEYFDNKLKEEIKELKEQSIIHLKKHNYHVRENIFKENILSSSFARHHLSAYVELNSLISLNEILLGI